MQFEAISEAERAFLGKNVQKIADCAKSLRSILAKSETSFLQLGESVTVLLREAKDFSLAAQRLEEGLHPADSEAFLLDLQTNTEQALESLVNQDVSWGAEESETLLNVVEELGN